MVLLTVTLTAPPPAPPHDDWPPPPPPKVTGEWKLPWVKDCDDVRKDRPGLPPLPP